VTTEQTIVRQEKCLETINLEEQPTSTATTPPIEEKPQLTETHNYYSTLQTFH